MTKTLRLLIALGLLGTTASRGDVVYVTARPTPCTVTANCPGPNLDGTYIEHFPNLGDFGAAGTAPGHPPTTVARTYISTPEITDPSAGVTLMPVLGVPGGVYQIDYNFNSVAANTSTNIVMAVSCSGGTLSFSTTDKFQRAFGNPANQWQLMGYVTNDPGSSTPTITFTYLSGTVSGASQNRLLFDCWRFTLVEPCLSIPVVSVTGPLSTNLNEVVVTGVDASATAVTVYQDSGSGMVPIGTKTSGITAGNNVVSVSGLVKGAQVAATQTIGTQEGCTPVEGVRVGGGANPSVRIALTIRETSSTGPIGEPGSTSSGNLHFLGATAVSGGAPINADVFVPSESWQTVTFLRGTNETVGDVITVSGNTVAGQGYFPNDLVSVQVYAYRDLPNGITIYSLIPATSSDVSSNDFFNVNWTWDAVPGATGYRVVRSYNFAGYVEFQDVPSNNFVDANSGWGFDFTIEPTTAQGGRSVQWNPSISNTNNLPGQWGILESINFAIDNLDDTGPFDIYIDNIANGDTVFQTFEDAPAGTTDYGFRSPSFSGTTSGNLLTAPNIGRVVNNIADTGTKSFRISFQWNGLTANKWLRLTTSGVNNPQVNLDEPISFRMLMLPVNATPPPSPAAPELTVSQVGDSVVLSWPGGHRLQTAVEVDGTYTNVSQIVSPNTWTNITEGAFLSPWTNSFQDPIRFFRLVD